MPAEVGVRRSGDPDWEARLAEDVRRYIAEGRCANCGWREDPEDRHTIGEGVYLCHLCGAPKEEGGRNYGERPWGQVLLCIAIKRCPSDVALCGQECPRDTA